MKVGGQIPWNVTPICETSQIYYLLGRRPMKDVFGQPLKGPDDLRIENKQTKETKDFNKSEVDVVDVMGTPQTRDFNHREGEKPRTQHSCRKESTHGTRTTPR